MANNLVKGENLLSGKTLNDNIPLFAEIFEVSECGRKREFIDFSLFFYFLSPKFSLFFLFFFALSFSLYLFISLFFRFFFISFHFVFHSIFLCVFFLSQIGRRYKIMNPGKMRNTYGKLMWILMDTENHAIKAQLKVRKR